MFPVRFSVTKSATGGHRLVAGLVAITPAAGFVSPMSAILIGLAAGAVCYGGVMMKYKLRYDDTLDAFGVHGVGGALGALLTGVFAAKAWNPAGNDGLLAGNPKLMLTQLIATAAAMAYAAGVTVLIVKFVDVTVGLRVKLGEEQEGLDGALHGEEGYVIGPTTAHAAPALVAEASPIPVIAPSKAVAG